MRKKNIIDLGSFILKANEKHHFKYDYSKSIYNKYKDNIEIICPIHGSFYQTASYHIKSNGCPKCFADSIAMTNEEFVDRCSKSNPNIEIISKYNRAVDLVEVRDCLGIEYKTRANFLIKGGTPTINTAIDKTDAFIKKAVSKHGVKYDYSKTEYCGYKNKLTIICPEHGEFIQQACSHLCGNGCYYCGRNMSTEFISTNPTGWTISDWIKSSQRSTEFVAFSIYIIECSSNKEKFIKIGRTFRTVSKRFSCTRFPYEYTILYTETGNAHHMFKLESKLKRICKQFSYPPAENFNGKKECFTPDCLELLKDYIKPNNEDVHN